MTNHSTYKVERTLFGNRVEPNKNKLDKISNDDYMNFDENVHSDSDDILESDEDGYNSDCSLGSMNSVFLNLKKPSTPVNKINRTDTSQSNYDNSSNRSDQTQKNSIVTRIQSSEKPKNPIKKIDVVSFYGKPKSTQQHNRAFSKLSSVRQFKMKITNSQTLKYDSFRNKNKQNMNKLRVSLKARYKQFLAVKRTSSTKSIHKKNEKLLRNKLQIHIPLLLFKYKAVKKEAEQDNNKYSSSTVKTLLHNEIMCITNSLNPLNIDGFFADYNDTENIISELNTFNVDDFMDEDDFEDPRITSLIEETFQGSDVFTENNINCQWNSNGDVDLEPFLNF